ncbi:hypothetical protein BH10ACT3_BH10ACT3_05800 [soil metagenome]
MFAPVSHHRTLVAGGVVSYVPAMGRDEQALRQTIEFRTGLAIAAAVALAATAPLFAMAGSRYRSNGWSAAALGIPPLAALIATFGLTGWWIDSIRAWWGPHRWFNTRSSLWNWLIPFVNLIAPPLEAGLLFQSAGRSERWGKVWAGGWVLVVFGSVFHIQEIEGVVNLVSGLVISGLMLWLVISSIRSLRAEWRRQDSFAASA